MCFPWSHEWEKESEENIQMKKTSGVKCVPVYLAERILFGYKKIVMRCKKCGDIKIVVG